MPLFNGERFLEQTLNALLAQTFEDFELIISDNASGDGTLAICETYAACDGRIVLTRNATNRGASFNYNKVVGLARGEYFKWAAYDDLCAPTYLERCVEALDGDAGAVLSYPVSGLIDLAGEPIAIGDDPPRAVSDDLVARFTDCLSPFKIWQNPIFGLIRRGPLSRTGLIGPYLASDRCLLAELALAGRFLRIPERLFLRRKHADNVGVGLEHLEFFDPRLKGRVVVPELRIFREHLRSVGRARLGIAAKRRLQWEVCRWFLGRHDVVRHQMGAALRARGRRARAGRGAGDGPGHRPTPAESARRVP
jgi:glycosyltransferase involved in cell wall biosynthesis